MSQSGPRTEPDDNGGLRIAGEPDAIAGALLTYGELGFDEVRVNLEVPAAVSRTDAIAGMADVVSRVHAG